MSSTLAGDVPATIYNRRFWLAYTANVVLVAANALNFRFAEFVNYLGGSEETTGHIVGVGLIGALVVRLVLGQAIDGLGVRRVWLCCSVVFLVGSGMFLFIRDLGPVLYVGRALYMVGLAAMFACSIFHIQHEAPPERRTELIGSLGSSGFLGMIVGTQAGDLIFNTIRNPEWLYGLLFGATAALGFAYLVLILILTRRDAPVRPTLAPPLHRLAFRYWPGWVLLVALMMGLGMAVTTVFLTRYTTVLGLSGIRTFFLAYALSAFTFRWVSRTWSQSMGRHRVILLGLIGHAIGHLLLMRVASEWGLVLPALCAGFGHALLFPCVVSLGAGAFPVKYRGTGTTFTLGFVDLGMAASSPLLGKIVDQYPLDPRQGFLAMFVASAVTMLLVSVVYGLATLRFRDADMTAAVEPVNTAAEPVPVLEVAAAAACVEPVSCAD